MRLLNKSLLAVVVMLGVVALGQVAKPAEGAGLPSKYKLLKAGAADAFVSDLNAAADKGYRLIAAGPFYVLRLESAPPETYRYIKIAEGGGPVKFLNWLNEQAARGYRMVPFSGVMEKAPHPRNYEYVSAGHTAMGDPVKASALSYLVGQGYVPLQPAAFSGLLGSYSAEFLMEREVGAKPKTPVTVPDQIQIADAMKADNVMKHVDEDAKNGYRYVGPYVSRKGGGIALLMEKCDESCGGTFDYRYFDAKDTAQMERDLNANGKEGFRVIAAGLRQRPHIMERKTGDKTTFAYRVLTTKDKELAEAEKALNAAAEEGFVPLGYVWRIGWTAEGYLILEKATAASPAVSAAP